MVSLHADQGWFTITIEDGPAFEVYAFEGREKLNEPYEFVVELVSRDANIDLVRLIGCPTLLTAAEHGGGQRKIHGSIREAQQLHSGNAFTHYRIVIVPRLWYLGQNQNHRIFQNMTVMDIMDQIFKEQGFLSQAVSWKLKEKYQPREYCVQYAESDLYFISRLCEEEGIYYYFEHNDNSHTLCFSDASGGADIPGGDGGLLRFFPGSGQAADSAVITRLNVKQTMNSDQATYREWNFQQPPLDLEVTSKEYEQEKAPVPGGLKVDTYQFPHIYDLKSPGQTYAEIQMKRQLTFSRWVEGEGGVSRLLPGFAFTLHSHPRRDANAQWWLTEVHHKGEQPQVLEHEAPDRGFFYHSEFTAIPYETRFVPPVVHPKKRIEGLQSAIVTGPGSEEVYVDEYGRVKVHFHWDRLGPMTDRSTCWVRVADGWAGQNFGFIQPPRVGQELIVEFMEGDPDRPVITGRVYNAEKMPPWKLPEQKVLSGIQSREFGGGQRNHVVFDDTPGQVQTQLSSDHNLSQLNLGYITRVNHIDGRKDFRGEGFELRTDGWGAIRAAKGLFIGTDKRIHATSYHKDIGEAVGQLQGGETQHSSQAELGVMHKAIETSDQKAITDALKVQNKELVGSGKAHGEMSSPHLLLSGPSGIEATTPESIHLRAGRHIAISAGENLSLSGAKSFLATALERIGLFAHNLGIRIFAAKGKVEIQAQSDDLDIIADKVMRLISAQEKIQLAAPKEIELMAGGSFMKLNSGGIEFGTSGEFLAQAAKHSFIGPKTATPDDCPLPSGLINDEQFVALDMNNKPLAGIPFKILEGGNVLAEGVTDLEGRTPRVYSIQEKPLEVVWDVDKLFPGEDAEKED